MSKNLSNIVAETIKLKIISGDYNSNNRLPVEKEIAEQFGVSRTTVREAIKILVSKNIVTIHRGKGTFINENPGVIDDPFGFDFLDKEELADDLCEFRYYVEPTVALLAARNATKKQISDMNEIMEKMRDLATTNPDDYYNTEAVNQFCNYELLFHSLLYEMTNNLVLQHLLPAILKSVHAFYFRQMIDERYDIDNAYDTHRSIFLAIRSRNEIAAYKSTKDHMLKPKE